MQAVSTVLVFLRILSGKPKNLSKRRVKVMNKYELLYIIASDVPEEKREELIKKFSSYIESKGGSVEGIDKWGMRKYAYPINFKNEGFYVLMNITMKSEDVNPMAKLMNITEGIERQLFVRKD